MPENFPIGFVAEVRVGLHPESECLDEPQQQNLDRTLVYCFHETESIRKTSHRSSDVDSIDSPSMDETQALLMNPVVFFLPDAN